MHYLIYTISDAVGETAGRIAKAAAMQFEGASYDIENFPHVNDIKTVEDIIQRAAEHHAIVIFTSVVPKISYAITENCKAKGVECIDVMSPAIDCFSRFLTTPPSQKPGLSYKLDANYFKRIAAMEFAVKYDDGKDPRGLALADIIIIGVSRTSKTPLSMYMANFGYQVANIPIVPDVPLPKELYETDKSKIIGLITDPEKLCQIRSQRLRAMGLSSRSNYANIQRILDELDYAEKIMSKLACPIINTADKAIEETALEIREMLNI